VRPLIVDLGRDYRGGQHQALLLLQGVREHGHAPELIAVRNSTLAARAAEMGAPVFPVDPGRRRMDAARLLRRFLREGRIDLVHANEPHALTAAWLARAHRTVPVVASRRVTLPLARGYFSLARYRAASRIIAVSQFVKHSVVQSGLAPGQVAVVFDGVQIPPEISGSARNAARKQLGISPEARVVGYVAAFVPQKRHGFLLEAFARLISQFPGSFLLLRGAGPELPRLQARARELQIVDFVKFLTPDVSIHTAFAAMDVFAFPAIGEALGTGLLAAMAHALPVAAIASGGVSEVVEDGKNGLMMKNPDSSAFGEALAQILSLPDDGARLGRAARETVIANFSADRMVDGTLHLYEELIRACQ
jgi:L-malate glycosyltransferase